MHRSKPGYAQEYIWLCTGVNLVMHWSTPDYALEYTWLCTGVHLVIDWSKHGYIIINFQSLIKFI